MFWVWLIGLIFWLLIWKFYIRVYDMWDIFIGVYLLIWGFFLIGEIYWANLKFEFGFKYLLWILYFFRYLYLSYFCLCMGSFCKHVGKVQIYDTWSTEFHGTKRDSKSCKWSIELVVSLFWYIFYFPLLFGFIFISSYTYSFVYIYWVCIELNIEQTKNFV